MRRLRMEGGFSKVMRVLTLSKFIKPPGKPPNEGSTGKRSPRVSEKSQVFRPPTYQPFQHITLLQAEGEGNRADIVIFRSLSPLPGYHSGFATARPGPQYGQCSAREQPAGQPGGVGQGAAPAKERKHEGWRPTAPQVPVPPWVRVAPASPAL
jgi:hypothetical protein